LTGSTASDLPWEARVRSHTQIWRLAVPLARRAVQDRFHSPGVPTGGIEPVRRTTREVGSRPGRGRTHWCGGDTQRRTAPRRNRPRPGAGNRLDPDARPIPNDAGTGPDGRGLAVPEPGGSWPQPAGRRSRRRLGPFRRSGPVRPTPTQSRVDAQSPWTYDDDVGDGFGHGTAVTAVIADVAPRARWLPLRV
jgi:hypothetical protein